MTDDLDDLLAPRPADPPAGREALFLRTERRLARSRRLRQCARGAAVVAVFALGVVLGRGTRTQPEPLVPEVEVAVVPVVVPVPVPESPGAVTERPRSARELELLAEQSDDAAEVAKLYRAAGNAALDAEDYANAARCYRLFLARAGDTALSPASGDTWLLTSLKNAAFKEKLDGAP